MMTQLKTSLRQLLDSINHRDDLLDDVEHLGKDAIPPTGDDYSELFSEVKNRLTEIIGSIPDRSGGDVYRVVRVINGARPIAIALGLSLDNAVHICLKFTKLIEIEYGGSDEFYIEPD